MKGLSQEAGPRTPALPQGLHSAVILQTAPSKRQGHTLRPQPLSSPSLAWTWVSTSHWGGQGLLRIPKAGGRKSSRGVSPPRSRGGGGTRRCRAPDDPIGGRCGGCRNPAGFRPQLHSHGHFPATTTPQPPPPGRPSPRGRPAPPPPAYPGPSGLPAPCPGRRGRAPPGLRRCLGLPRPGGE